MSTSDTALVHAFAALKSATTDTARSHAAGTFYVIAHPRLTRRCAAMLERVAPADWLSGEDLASAALMRVVLHPTQAQACTSATADGILAFLRLVAYRDMQDTREARATRNRRACGLLTVHVDEAMLALQPSVQASEPSDDDEAFWPSYTQAVQQLHGSQQRAWILCVEQDTPMSEAARHLGVDRTTVWRQLYSAAAHLRVSLLPLLLARRPHAPQAILPPPAPRRER